MKHIAYTFIFLMLITAQAHATEYPEAFRPIEKLFAAMSEVDHGEMKAAVTDSFILLEHGEVWSIDDLMRVVSPSEYVRTNYFSIISMEVKSGIATVNYWNKANFNNGKDSKDVIWLESAVLHMVDGEWLVSQLHSTRLPAGKSPEGVDFK